MDLASEAARRGRPLAILVTRLRYLGDIILTIPAVSALRARYPDAEIWYFAERPHAAILEGHPDLDGVIATARDASSFVGGVRDLRARRFLAAVDLFYNPRSAWTLFLAGIPIRAGGTRRGRRRLYTHHFGGANGAHSAVMHHIRALELFDIRGDEALPRVYLGAEEREEGRRIVSRLLGRMGGESGVVALHPGGTWPAKRWPVERFGGLAREIRKRLGAAVLVVAGPGEEETARAVADLADGGAAVLPLQSVRALASALDACRALVANDGGVMHLGAALGVPTVGVFGPTEPEIWFPYAGKGPFVVVTSGAACAPCHRHRCDTLKCLLVVGEREVFEALGRALAWPS